MSAGMVEAAAWMTGFGEDLKAPSIRLRRKVALKLHRSENRKEV